MGRCELLIIMLSLLSWRCGEIKKQNKLSKEVTNVALENKSFLLAKEGFTQFNRQNCIETLNDKINKGQPLIVHVQVPLCDNDHQGILPVGGKLGDGLNLKNNLYWGAMYGLKNYFKKNKHWKLLLSKKDTRAVILERVILYREYPNNAKVYLVMDAYRGDRMKLCIENFLNSIAGKLHEQIAIQETILKINSGADLLVFNGHNGLMDNQINIVNTQDDKIRDVSVISCLSHDYFLEYLKYSKGYPLLMTTNLMAPEAYVLNALINNWAMQKNPQQIREGVGRSYHKYQKCGIKGATNLFKTGW